MIDLSTPESRAKLDPRSWPYSHKISKGKFLEYRKGTTGAVWLAKLRTAGMSKPMFHPIGDEADYTFEEALAKALEWLSTDGKVEVSPSKLTHRVVCSQYLTWRHNERSYAGYKSTRCLFMRHIFNHPLADKQVSKTTAQEYQEWLDALGEQLVKRCPAEEPEERIRRGRHSANLAWAHFRAALYQASRKFDLDPTEWRKVKSLDKPKNRPQPRMVVLSDRKKEPTRLYNACDSDELRDILWFMGETACRPGEAYNMRVSDYDADRGEWDVSHSKTGPRTQTLTKDACKLLDRLCMGRNDPTGYVFCTPKGQPWTTARMQHPFRRAVIKAKLPKDVVTYTLRHTRISAWLASGAIALDVAQQVGTSLAMLQKHYAKFMPSDSRSWMERASQGAPPESNVAVLP